MPLFSLVGYFVFFYPIIMSVTWTVGAVFFYYRIEKHSTLPELAEFPMVSILVPCHNEEKTINETVTRLLSLSYPNYEVIVVDDGSTDKTSALLKALAGDKPVRVISLKKKSGKPSALNTGILACRGQIIVTVDADAFLDKDALTWMVWHFIHYPRVGAVTANPRVRNRTTLLAKIQTAEYSSIIGLIKRTQRNLGKVLTVSGVASAFRLRALVDVRFWDTDMITDDINLTWKLEKRFWDVRYEPKAICWILVPETLSGLWRQRKRWSQGCLEVLRRHRDVWFYWKCRRIWPVYIDQVLAVIWSVTFVCFTALFAVNLFLPDFGFYFYPIPTWYGGIISVVSIGQFFVSLWLDGKYDSTLKRYYLWVIWYPFLYCILNPLTVVASLYQGLFRPLGKQAVWTSPDRGYLPVNRQGGS